MKKKFKNIKAPRHYPKFCVKFDQFLCENQKCEENKNFTEWSFMILNDRLYHKKSPENKKYSKLYVFYLIFDCHSYLNPGNLRQNLG